MMVIPRLRASSVSFTVFSSIPVLLVRGERGREAAAMSHDFNDA